LNSSLLYFVCRAAGAPLQKVKADAASLSYSFSPPPSSFYPLARARESRPLSSPPSPRPRAIVGFLLFLVHGGKRVERGRISSLLARAAGGEEREEEASFFLFFFSARDATTVDAKRKKKRGLLFFSSSSLFLFIRSRRRRERGKERPFFLLSSPLSPCSV